jgi:DNA (cytosine-5)-methyltransferase 1
MKFGSVCSGIEAASVAWEPLGWKAAWFSEIEPFPCAVLKHHYPDVPNFGDMTTLPRRIISGEIEAPDLFCGGTPCQAFSVAGMRKSLDDARGNLSLTFCEIANAIDNVRLAGGEHPAIIFWENVPGVLSTKDNAFGCFLAGLAGEDGAVEPPGGKWANAGCVYGPQRAVAWRVLDAQYFGVAQRRRRVFVVASARADFDPAAVLFEFDGVRRDTAPSREARQTVTGTIEASLGRSRGAGTPTSAICPTLRAGGNRTGGDRPPGTDVDTADSLIAMCLNAGGMNRLDAESETLLPINIYGGNKRQDRPEGGFYVRMDEETSKTLDAATGLNPTCSQGGTAVMQPIALQDVTPREKAQNGKGWNDDGSAYTVDTHATQGVMQAIAFSRNDDGRDATTDLSPTMRVAGRAGGMLGVAQPIAWSEELTASIDLAGTVQRGGAGGRHDGVAQPVGVDCYNWALTGDVSITLKRGDGNPAVNQPTVLLGMAVRRLTPVECERLQGFPDGYTEISWRKKPASECPDGPRYKALGNSWAVPVVRWIGKRIEMEIKCKPKK